MRYIVGVTTTKPSSTATTGSSGGGCLTLLDPKTGAVLSSLRSSVDMSGKAGMGISSLSSFPQDFSTMLGGGDMTQPVIAYGGNSVKKSDNYGMLVSIRSASSPPILHWKCRLPETEMSGFLLVSPCGFYIAGGGTSGSCYIWSSMGGQLLRTFKAHYRSCTCLVWSDCGRFLCSGGKDGMVHVFSLMGLVDVTSVSRNDSKRNIPPLHTFSLHLFPVTSLAQLSGGRIASAAEDGQVAVMELFSRQVIANIKFPHGIQCVEHYDGRLYAGSMQGTIYSVDLDAYAMHQSEKHGAVFVSNKRRRQERVDARSTGNSTIEETVFGNTALDNHLNTRNNNNADNHDIDGAVGSSGTVYQTDWIGHDHPVTSIALLMDTDYRKMISGDRFGQVRIWDIDSRICVNVIQPWSHCGSVVRNTLNPKSGDGKSVSGHPVTSINLIPQPDGKVTSGLFESTTGRNKNLSNISTLIAPLEKYISDVGSVAAGIICVPFMKRNLTEQNLKYWEAEPMITRKRRKRCVQPNLVSSAKAFTDKEDEQLEQQQTKGKEQVVLMSEEIMKLQDQLKEKDSEVKRWETVNNQLLLRLQAKS